MNCPRAVCLLTAALIATLALVTVARPARAGGCGDAGGGSSDSGSSSDSSDAGSSSGSTSSEACVDATDVVGLRRCRAYGDLWAREEVMPWLISLGVGLFPVGFDRLSGTGTATHESGRVDLPVGAVLSASASAPGAADWALMTEGRMGVAALFFEWLYAGVGMSVGGGSLDVTTTTTRGDALDHTVTVGSALGVGAWTELGAALGLGPVTLRSDVRLGGRLVLLDVRSVVDDCVVDTVVEQWMGIVEPRLGVDVWLHPSISLGLMGGYDVLAAPGRGFTGGLDLRFHTAPHDGQR